MIHNICAVCYSFKSTLTSVSWSVNPATFWLDEGLCQWCRWGNKGLPQMHIVSRWQRISLQAHPLSPKPNSFLLTAWHCLSEFSSRKTEDINMAAISNQAHPPKCNTSSNLLRIQWNFSYGMVSVLAKAPRPCGKSMERDQVSFMPAPTSACHCSCGIRQTQ